MACVTPQGMSTVSAPKNKGANRSGLGSVRIFRRTPDKPGNEFRQLDNEIAENRMNVEHPQGIPNHENTDGNQQNGPYGGVQS